jgi:hypothetical protein
VWEEMMILPTRERDSSPQNRRKGKLPKTRKIRTLAMPTKIIKKMKTEKLWIFIGHCQTSHQNPMTMFNNP